MPVSADEFRATLARWASGVTVVTARHAQSIAGMTVSAFCSVSLEPPLVLICAGNDSETCNVIQAGGYFAVNILAEHQQSLSLRFSDPELEGQRFDGLKIDDGEAGLPLLPETVASLQCRVVDCHPAGDHLVFIGEVLRAQYSERAPLLFLQGAYGHFTTG